MRKALIIILSAVVIAILAGTYFLFQKEDLESAISEFESGDYKDALVILNRLSSVTDYDKAEKIYYYRCKAINRMAEKLEDKYKDELKASALGNTDAEERSKEKNYLERKLKDINDDLQTDFTLVIDKKMNRILSKGKYYDQFITKYKGSRYIEDLDYEELEKLQRSDREKLLNSIVSFYSRYPNTAYISQLVRMLFDNLQKGGLNLKGRDDFLKNLIIDFGRKYPTSSEFHRIYTCVGDKVNLRNSPGVDGKLMGKIERDEIVIQMEKSMDTSQVGDIRDYWYKIANLHGLQGWIFGKFLQPFDISRYKLEEKKETWSLEEYFKDWADSNTPLNWVHIDGGLKSAITFYDVKDKRFIKITAPKDSTAGLFRRASGAYSFQILSRARFLGGGSIVLFAHVMNNRKVFYLKLKNEQIEVNEITIPFHTSEWHSYTLTSEDGRYGRLYIDNELISSRIPPLEDRQFAMKGIYFLFSAKGEASATEAEYLKIK